VRKYLVITMTALMLSVPGLHRAFAQTLDDAIDAELDDVSAGLNSPSTAPKSGDMGDIDDIQLDDGGSAPPQTAQAPEATPAPQAPASPDGELDQALVDDELKIDDEAPATAQAPQTPQDDLSVELDDGASDAPPQEVAKPSDEMPDLAPQVVDVPSAPEVEPAPEIDSAPPKVASAISIDGGNAAIEKRLAKYARGYKQVPDMNWDEIVGERRQENYRLQRGDTLWDISETFFGDGFFWAKLWSQNGVIGNPHKIMRGKGIRFVAGTEADAPAIAVVDRNANISTNPLSDGEFDPPTYREQIQGEVTPEEIESGVVLETDELIPAPELPPPGKRAMPLKQLPASFAETKIDVQAAGYDASGIKGAPAIQANVAPTVFLNSMILDGKPNDIGKVDEIETQERVAGTGQSVFLTARKELQIGQRVTFIRRRDRPSGAAGPVVDIEGVGVVDGVIKESSNTYRVTITTALFPIEKGALALEEAPPRVTMTHNGRRSDVKVKVVGGEFDDARKLLGTPAVVYLNGGSSSGLQKGDVLAVEARRGSRRETKYPDLVKPIALIKVGDVREKVATAAVLTSIDGIVVGDMTGGDWPEDLPSLRTETASESASKFGRTEPVDIE
jgi:nucleoid-associated protein YgaU